MFSANTTETVCGD